MRKVFFEEKPRIELFSVNKLLLRKAAEFSHIFALLGKSS